LIINSIFGFFLLCESNDLITAYLAIELQGLSFYVLTSFKKSSVFSVEAGIKYFILGSFSTALFLFGTSLIYGLTGSVVNFDFQNFFY
jgi:NADH:ubiquinone oxidoreductase subunit 2 (subunit N)